MFHAGVEVANYEFLQKKEKEALSQFFLPLDIEVMHMLLEEDVTLYAGPKGRHRTAECTA